MPHAIQLLLDLHAAAAYVEVSPSVLEGWLAAGRGPTPTPVRGKPFYSIDALNRFLDGPGGLLSRRGQK